MHWETRFRELAAMQAGVVGRDQLDDLGCTIDEWWRARRSRRWQALSPRVLALEGMPAGEEQRAHAGVLDAGAGAHLHGPSTLAWFGRPGYDLSQIHVVRERGTTSTPCQLATVHRVRSLAPEDRMVVRGVPTVTPLRAIWSEASRYADERLHDRGVQRIGRLVDDAEVAGLLTRSALQRSVAELRRRGRAGSRVMREVAEQRPVGERPTESRLEERFEAVVAEADLSPFERQVLVGGQEVIGRVDFRDPTWPLVAEVNSLTFHASPSDQRADEARYEAMLSAGFTVAVVWEPDVWSRPGAVQELVRVARTRARRGVPAVLHSPGCPWPHDPGRRVVGGRGRPLRG